MRHRRAIPILWFTRQLEFVQWNPTATSPIARNAGEFLGVFGTVKLHGPDAWALELVAQQKCGYHIIHPIDKVLEDKAGSTRAFGETLRTLLKDAIALWQRYHAGGVDDYTREARNITQAIDRHLKPRSLDDPDNQCPLDQIGWHHAGGNLLPFLDQPEVAAPTNNRAERALPPCVTARKVSHCSKSADIETACKRGKSLVSGLMDLFRSDNQASDPIPSDSASGAS